MTDFFLKSQRTVKMFSTEQHRVKKHKDSDEKCKDAQHDHHHLAQVVLTATPKTMNHPRQDDDH
jgi:hypothetical protein